MCIKAYDRKEKSYKISKRCVLKRCKCGHTNYCHGPGGCGGGIQQGAIERHCTCETFKLAENQKPNPKRIDRMRFGTHQG